jgi:hypothetical protein
MRAVTATALAMLVAGCAIIVKGTDQQIILDTPGYLGAESTLTSPPFTNPTTASQFNVAQLAWASMPCKA